MRVPHFLRACRCARAAGDATVLHDWLEQLRSANPSLHAALRAHPDTLMRVVNHDVPPAADGSTAELRLLWAWFNVAQEEAAAARAACAAAEKAHRKTALRLELALCALRAHNIKPPLQAERET